MKGNKIIVEKLLEKEARVGNKLLTNSDITETPDASLKSLSKKYTKVETKEHEQHYINKNMHGYYYSKQQQDDNVDISAKQQRSRTKQITSQFEGYLEAIQDQAIPTEFLVHKRQIDSGQSPAANHECRLCKINIEDVSHIISSCPKMSTRHYLPLRHDALAKYILKVIITKNHPNERYSDLTEYEFVKKIGDNEYRRNILIKTATKIPHNELDQVIWEKANKLRSIF